MERRIVLVNGSRIEVGQVLLYNSELDDSSIRGWPAEPFGERE